MGLGPFTGLPYPIVDPFNMRTPTSILYQSSTQFDGTLQLNPPVVEPGTLVHPVQAGGGLLIPGVPIVILEVIYSGGGTLTITRTTGTAGSIATTIATLAALANTPLGPDDTLQFVSSGATNPKLLIIAQAAPIAVGE
jgi:hypothetical protein